VDLVAGLGRGHVGAHAVHRLDDQQEVFLVDILELDARRDVGHQARGLNLQLSLSLALATSRSADSG
jgi:hypothetical protein